MEDVFYYLTLPLLLEGTMVTLLISAVAMPAGVVLGLILALMRLSPIKPLNAIAWFYIWIIRGTPLLLQLVFIYDALPRFASFSPRYRPRSSALRSTRLHSQPRLSAEASYL